MQVFPLLQANPSGERLAISGLVPPRAYSPGAARSQLKCQNKTFVQIFGGGQALRPPHCHQLGPLVSSLHDFFAHHPDPRAVRFSLPDSALER